MIYVVTYLYIDLGRIEFRVDKAFNSEDDALQYCKEQTGSNIDQINYEVHELEAPE